MAYGIRKDIIISIRDIPPAAYDTISDKVLLIHAELMRTMDQYSHLLVEESDIEITYQPSKNNNTNEHH